MRYSIALLALVGAATAVPTRLARDVKVVNDVEVDTVVDVVTDVVTVVGGAPTPAPAAPAPNNAQPSPNVHVVTVVQGAPSPAPPAPAPPAPAPTPAAAAPAPAAPEAHIQAAAPAAPAAPAPAPASPAPASGSPSSQDMLAVANKYRSSYNLPQFTWDNTLAANAQKTVTDDGGSNEKHELNPGSFAQVLTPGNLDKALMNLSGFEVAYVGGWLCEEPVPQLNGMCPELDKQAGLDVSGETGHADILRNGQYTKIGCAFASNGGNGPWTGLWGCDLAP